MSDPYALSRDAHAPSVSLVRPSGPILVASDATTSSAAAFPLAQVIGEYTKSEVQVFSALGALATSMYAFDGLPMPDVPDDGLRHDREEQLRTQLRRLVPSSDAWPITVRGGESTREIVDFAAAVDAQVILTGRGRHGVLERVVGGETVLRMLQLGDRPILAVEPGLTWLPRRVVIATDLSEYSLYAAEIALNFIAPDARVFLVSVGPAIGQDGDALRARVEAYREQAQKRFVEMRQILARAEVQFEDVLLTGDVAGELLRFAESSQADLIVSATHGYGFVRRLLLGSVATVLVRAAPCSVLCVPGSARHAASMRAEAEEAIHTRALPLAEQDAELARFAERHAGARCRVTVHTTDAGTQVLGASLTLVGATFDPGARAASLMFGASQYAGQHLTHNIAQVSEVHLSSDREHHDRAIRFVHRGGSTTVALE
jgi:nucleotide-binding universal stress UspA family protein